MSEGKRGFSSRIGMMLAMLGMAVGTGNIWRFPRIAGKNGGGEFLVAWLAFLLLWSIPLVLLELAAGRKTRRGPVQTFIQMMGPRWAWMGAFVVFVTTAISFYYSVVAGWTVRFTVASVTGEIPDAVPGTFWKEWTTSPWPILTHGIMIGLAVLVVSKGVKVIEKVALVLMPALLLLLIALTIRALMLDGSSKGLSYLFTVDWENLKQPNIWIEALIQNAWDTGAGWGLVLCYAAYAREKEDTALNACLIPTANNAISLLAGVMIFCTVFSVMPHLVERSKNNPAHLEALNKDLAKSVEAGEPVTQELMQTTVFSEGNEGITFVWMPQLFERIPGGQFFMILFFLALSFAAFTSLIAMVEMITRTLVDAGMPRGRAVSLVGIVGFLLGIPSALSLAVFTNQDWVWGVALMLSGLFFSIAAIANGVSKLRKEHLNHENSDIHIGRWWDVVITFLIPVLAVFLFVWFLISWKDTVKPSERKKWLLPFETYNVGTVLFQVSVVLVLLILCNRWIVRGQQNDESQKER